MKITHIIALIVIAIGIGIVVVSTGNASAYVSFMEAKKSFKDQKDKDFHVVGTLKKSSQGEIIGLDNKSDKLSFSFVMVDTNNQEQRVFYNEPMPQDFLKSEQIVVVGKYTDKNLFLAKKILLKCPSKYKEEEKFAETNL